MSDEMNGLQSFADEMPVPTLTLEPAIQEEKPLAETIQEKPEPKVEEPKLTPQEQKMVDDFAQQIDLTNSNLILQYGAGTQKKMADFSEAALANVQTQDLGEAGQLITELVKELKGFEDQEEEKGFFGFFKKNANKVTALKAKYDKAEVNVNKIVDSLQEHQVRLMKDTATLDKMYALNLNYFKELSMYILAGKKKLEEVRSTQLAELMEKAQRSGLPEDAQASKDLDSMCNRF